MIQEHIRAAELAGIDHLKHVFFQTRSRVIERTATVIDDAEYVHLAELKDGKSKLICIAPPEYATLVLAGILETGEE